jgi:polygalacturonase
MIALILVESAMLGRACALTLDLKPTGQNSGSDTQAIQQAIDRCAESGGGTVTLRGGTFTSGSLFLRSHVSLRLERDAILNGSTDDADYPTIDTRIAGLEMKHPAALVNAIDCTDVALLGEGTIDGSGKKWWDRFWQYRAEHGKGIDFEVPRPRLVCFTRCQRARVSGLTLQNPPFWCLHILYSADLDIDGLTIRAPKKAASSDGIDVDSSRDVRISRCDIACDDDCISIKAGRDADGLRVNRPSENVTIADCTFGAGEGVAMGSETAGGIRNVIVRRCTFDGSKEAIRIKTAPGRGGVVENIAYEDLTIRRVARPIEIVMNWGGDGWKKHVDPKFAVLVPADKAMPIVRGIHLRNVSATDCPTAGVITGLRESPPTDVTFENVHLSAGRGLSVSNAPELNFAGLKIDAAEGPEIIRRGADSR